MDWGAWRVTVHGVSRVRHDLVTSTFTFMGVSGRTRHPLLPASLFMFYFFIPPWMLPGIISQINYLHLNHVWGIYFWGTLTKSDHLCELHFPFLKMMTKVHTFKLQIVYKIMNAKYSAQCLTLKSYRHVSHNFYCCSSEHNIARYAVSPLRGCRKANKRL